MREQYKSDTITADTSSTVENMQKSEDKKAAENSAADRPPASVFKSETYGSSYFYYIFFRSVNFFLLYCWTYSSLILTEHPKSSTHWPSSYAEKFEGSSDNFETDNPAACWTGLQWITSGNVSIYDYLFDKYFSVEKYILHQFTILNITYYLRLFANELIIYFSNKRAEKWKLILIESWKYENLPV